MILSLYTRTGSVRVELSEILYRRLIAPETTHDDILAIAAEASIAPELLIDYRSKREGLTPSFGEIDGSCDYSDQLM
ncbi:MAG: hypothetical protein AB7S65_01625 [Sulfuricurvum sp.]